eukprot:353136-Pyramimonas_sp.AAC.2
MRPRVDAKPPRITYKPRERASGVSDWSIVRIYPRLLRLIGPPGMAQPGRRRYRSGGGLPRCSRE